MSIDFQALAKPFPPADVSWRIGTSGKTAKGDFWAQVLAYIDNRNIMERLDSVVGPDHWCNEFRAGPQGGVICGISIEVEPGKWLTKWDGAENTEFESVKGGLSDAMKRAAVQWGVGRYLYDIGESWAEIVEKGTPGAKYAKTKADGAFYWLPPRDALAKLGANPIGPQRAAPASVAQINAQTSEANKAVTRPQHLSKDDTGAFDHEGYFVAGMKKAKTDESRDLMREWLATNRDHFPETFHTNLERWYVASVRDAAGRDRLTELAEMLDADGQWLQNAQKSKVKTSIDVKLREAAAA